MKLGKTADVIVENSRVGWLAKLGLGAKDLLAARPELVYVSTSD